MINRLFFKILLSLILILHSPGIASHDFDLEAIHRQGHFFNQVNTYKAVQTEVDGLLAQGIAPEDIAVLTDWDGVVNTPGAWEQKYHTGQHVCPETKRMLLEHEVDHVIRDEKVHDIHEYVIGKGVAIIVTTARPPVDDSKLPEMVGMPNLLDLRHPENTDRIDYEEITTQVRKRLLQMPEQELLDESSRKIATMEKRSKVSLTSQPRLNRTFITTVAERRNVFHMGFCFVNHDKVASVLTMFETLGWKPRHVIVIDDSPRALGSYVKVMHMLPWHVHLLYYPPENPTK